MSGKMSLNYSVLLRITLAMVGVHSMLLGATEYVFTTASYQFFFSVDPDNFFYIKQSGVFLFLAVFFYLIPAVDMKRYKLVIAVVVFSKVIAVTFLVSNAHTTPSPIMIYLAALGDGLMATAISVLTALCYKNNTSPFDS